MRHRLAQATQKYLTLYLAFQPNHTGHLYLIHQGFRHKSEIRWRKREFEAKEDKNLEYYLCKHIPNQARQYFRSYQQTTEQPQIAIYLNYRKRYDHQQTKPLVRAKCRQKLLQP